ncbi:MAG TPA: hypothetical protein VIA62_27315 [Thermoanaerobaculia bacterium]|jgi:urease beta subunit|nr:hypothetical protein [Thermoanaerobaculia bacterium]
MKLIEFSRSGWAMGADGHRVELRAGQGVRFERGENRSKGSETGMTAIMIQVSELECLGSS